jgi:hypothetical protein
MNIVSSAISEHPLVVGVVVGHVGVSAGQDRRAMVVDRVRLFPVSGFN